MSWGDRVVSWPRFLRASINLMTAAGVGCSTVAVLRAFEGYPRASWLWMGAALVIDLVDGPAVRTLGLEDRLPGYDGERLDEYTDLVTFVVAPVCFAWAYGLLPVTAVGLLTGGWVCAVSALQFARQHNKTGQAFWGWPAYWNVVFFYGWGLPLDSGLIVVLCWVLGVASFVPVPFVHPVRCPHWRPATLLGGGLWVAILVTYLVVPSTPRWLLAASMAYPAYYFTLSLILYDHLAREQDGWGQPDREGYNG